MYMYVHLRVDVYVWVCSSYLANDIYFLSEQAHCVSLQRQLLFFTSPADCIHTHTCVHPHTHTLTHTDKR